MTTVTQKIPNLLGGISEQPDVKKLPGQVRDAVNIFPEYALGLLKRPGAKFEAPLRGALDDAHWFEIISDAASYVGQIKLDGEIPLIKLWFKDSGIPRAVDLQEYLSSLSVGYTQTYEDKIVLETTALTNWINNKTGLQTAHNDWNTEYLKTIDQVTRTFTIETTYNVGDIYQLLKFGVLENAAGVKQYYKDGVQMTGSTSNGVFTETSSGDKYKAGSDRTDDYPMLMGNLIDHKLYELDAITEATLTLAQLDTYYTNTYKPEVDKYADLTLSTGFTKLLEDAQSTTDTNAPTYTSSNNPAAGRNYFLDETVSPAVACDVKKDLKFVTIQDTTFVLNTKKKVTWDTVNKTPELKFDEGFINFNVITSGDYVLTIKKLSNDSNGKEPHEDGYVETLDTSFSTDGIHEATATVSTSLKTVQAIRDSWNTTFNGAAPGGVGSSEWGNWTFDVSGSGIYISHPSSQFRLSVTAPQEDAAVVIRHEVTDVGKLPLQIKNGYKVKIGNTSQVTIDDYYVKFVSEDGTDYGVGTWEETVAGGLEHILNKHTMPHILKVESDGRFVFKPYDDWENRLVGDEETNPTPSFVTKTGEASKFIRDMFLYRNRMGMLSEDNVVLSRAGEFYNFFSKSASAAADDDPIDISVSTTDSPLLNYVLPEAAGLILFGEKKQFLLSTDSDTLAPTTAKVNQLTGFDSDSALHAIGLGNTSAFFSKSTSNTKMYELIKINNVESPDYIDQTGQVPELLPKDIDTIIGSPAVSLVSFGKLGTTTLYHFSYLRFAGKEITKSWYKWILPGPLHHQFFDGNTMNCVVKSGTKYYVTSFDVAQSTNDGVLTLDSGKKTNLCLDVWYNNPTYEYEEINGGAYVNRTKIHLPFTPFSDRKLAVVIYGNKSQVFDGDVTTLTPVQDGSHFYLFIDGDWRGASMVIGYKYDMTVELPQFYLNKSEGERIISDPTGNLIIHRLKVSTGLSGPVDYKMSITGIEDRTDTVTVTPANAYLANSVNMSEFAQHTVPVHQRNTNLFVTIKGTTAFPVTIESLNWEGRYSTNFYKRM